MVQGMEIRNKFYNSYSARNPAMFGVREAAQKVQGSLGIASMMNQTTSIFIIDQKTVVIIPMGQHVLLLDSHCQTQSGVYIAMTPSSRIWELMEWYKAFNCFPYSMGTVTNIIF